jgi:hypothetical protein
VDIPFKAGKAVDFPVSGIKRRLSKVLTASSFKKQTEIQVCI